MSLSFRSLSTLQQLALIEGDYHIVVRTDDGFFQSNTQTLRQYFVAGIEERLEEISSNGLPTIWPTARTLTVGGAVTGQVSFDGSGDMNLQIQIADGSLSLNKIQGLNQILLNIEDQIAALNTKNDALEVVDDALLFNGQTVYHSGNISAIGGDKNSSYEQTSASALWQISHNLGKYPSVTCVDTAGSLVMGAVSYPSTNVVEVRFGFPMSGRAFLN